MKPRSVNNPHLFSKISKHYSLSRYHLNGFSLLSSSVPSSPPSPLAYEYGSIGSTAVDILDSKQLSM